MYLILCHNLKIRRSKKKKSIIPHLDTAVNSLILQIPIQCVLCARQSLRYCRFYSKQNKQNFLCSWSLQQPLTFCCVAFNNLDICMHSTHTYPRVHIYTQRQNHGVFLQMLFVTGFLFYFFVLH